MDKPVRTTELALKHKYRQEGMAIERERIIALLETMNGQGTIQTYVRLNGTDKPSPSGVYIDRLLAIALIKGESNG